MVVKIRLKRTGRRNRPCYRIAVADAHRPRDGATLEILGMYDPLVSDDAKASTVDVARADYWLGVGAQPSETVVTLFKKHGVSLPAKRGRKPRRRSRAS